jgi:hypothetical protein
MVAEYQRFGSCTQLTTRDFSPLASVTSVTRNPFRVMRDG